MNKLFLGALMPIIALNFTACSTNTAEELIVAPMTQNENVIPANYQYQERELALMEVLNDYRESIGLNRLAKLDQASVKAEEHNRYMIAIKALNHDFFDQRAQDIIKAVGAKRVYENVARHFTQPQPLLQAWLNSPGHKANIEGDFTHFGLSITQDPATGKLYCTNIFVKI